MKRPWISVSLMVSLALVLLIWKAYYTPLPQPFPVLANSEVMQDLPLNECKYTEFPRVFDVEITVGQLYRNRTCLFYRVKFHYLWAGGELDSCEFECKDVKIVDDLCAGGIKVIWQQDHLHDPRSKRTRVIEIHTSQYKVHWK